MPKIKALSASKTTQENLLLTTDSKEASYEAMHKTPLTILTVQAVHKYLWSNTFHKDWCPIVLPGTHLDFPH